MAPYTDGPAFLAALWQYLDLCQIGVAFFFYSSTFPASSVTSLKLAVSSSNVIELCYSFKALL